MTMNSSRWRVRRLLVSGVLVAGAFALVASACGGDDDDDADEPTSTPTEAVTDPTESENGDDTTLELSAEDEFAFSTDTLTAPADTAFIIVFQNDDDLIHNVAIQDEAGETLAATDLETGPITQELEIEGLEAGEYIFICEVHPVDMVGTLTVE